MRNFDERIISGHNCRVCPSPDGERSLAELLESKGYTIVLKHGMELYAVHKDYLTTLTVE